MKSTQFDLIIKNGEVLTRVNNQWTWSKVDIGITDGRIAKLGTQLSGKKIFDAKNTRVLPGCIDTQVHFRDPGLTHKEDLGTGTLSAIKGGITGVFEMPNTKPNTSDKLRITEKLDIAAQKTFCDYAFYVGANGKNTAELSELENLPGVCGVKVFMGSSTGDLLVSEDQMIEQVLRSGHKRVAVHCEDESILVDRKDIAIKAAHPRAHPEWRNVDSALNATKRLIHLAEKTKRPVHTLHITTAEEIDFLKDHKNIASVEVLPQHLTLSAPDCYEKLGTLAQMNPPIRDIRHQKALWWGIQNGVVDILGSDHAPHTLEEKAKAYPESPSGMTGVQTILPLMLNHVSEGRLSLERVVELLCYNPCRIFKIKDQGEIKEGNLANFSIVDMQKNRTIERSWIASRSGWSPFEGMQIKGWPVATIIRGEIAMQEDDVLVNPGFGKKLDFL